MDGQAGHGQGSKAITRRSFVRTTAAAAAAVGAYRAAPFVGGVPPALGSRKIKLAYWSRDYNEKDAKQYAAEFMRAHPEYEISVEGLPWVGMYEKVNTALLAKKAPDLISCNLGWVPAFADLGVLHPLDRLWEKDVPKADRDDYFPAGLTFATYKGKLYGIPWRVDGNILIWSVDAFKEAGLDPAVAPDTWADVIEYGKKLTVTDAAKKVSQYGMCMAGKPGNNITQWFLYPVIWAFGGDLTDEEVTRSRMDEKPVIEAFKYAAALNTQIGVACPPAFSYSWSDLSPVLAKRATAMLFAHQANLKIIWNVSPDMKLAAGPYPKGPAGRFTRAGGWNHSIPVTAKVEDVWPFLLYLQEPMRQAVLTVGAPGRKAGLAHEKYETLRKDPLLRYAAGSGADTAHVRAIDRHPLSPRVDEEVGRIFSKAWEGKATPEEAVAEAHKRLTAMIKRA